MFSAFGDFTPELKNGIKGILSDIARAEEDVELSEKDIELLIQGWQEVCESEVKVPLVIEDKVEQFLEDKLE